MLKGLCCLPLLVLALMSGVMTGMAAPAHAAVTYTFLQFNTCGNETVCPNQGSTGAGVTALRNSILNHSPQPVAAS